MIFIYKPVINPGTHSKHSSARLPQRLLKAARDMSVHGGMQCGIYPFRIMVER